MSAIDLKDIPADVRARMGLTAPRKRRSLDIHGVRSNAIRVLAVMADLSQAERLRVLKHAIKVNAV